MFSSSLSLVLASISLVSLVTGQKVKIVSPASGCAIVPGSTLNLTLEVCEDLGHQVALGFGINCNSADTKSLGNLFLGTLDTTTTTFDASTKQLTYPLQIPAADKFTNGVSGSCSLVVSQYYISGPSNTPECNVVSVPAKVGASPNGPSPDNGAQTPVSPSGQPSKTPALQAEQPPSPEQPASTGDTPANPTTQGATPASEPASGSGTGTSTPAVPTGNTSPPDGSGQAPPSEGSNNVTAPSPGGSTPTPPCANGTNVTTGTVPVPAGSAPPLTDAGNGTGPSPTTGTVPVPESSATPLTDAGNGASPSPTTGNVPAPESSATPLTDAGNGTTPESPSGCSSSSYPSAGSGSTNDTSGSNSTNGTQDMATGCPPSGGNTPTTENGSKPNSTIFSPPAGEGNSTDNSAAGILSVSTQTVTLSVAVVLGCLSTLP